MATNIVTTFTAMQAVTYSAARSRVTNYLVESVVVTMAMGRAAMWTTWRCVTASALTSLMADQGMPMLASGTQTISRTSLRANWSTGVKTGIAVVGDGDTQLLLLPENEAGQRRAIVVDVAGVGKLSSFLDHLALTTLLPETERLFSLVVATHPHEDHIGGMAAFLDRFHTLVEEVWEPGYYHTTNAYAEMMRAIEDYDLRHTQPTSGTARFTGNLQITVLAPGVGIRGRFDSYGIEINNASIALKLDFPASRVIQRDEDRTYISLPSAQALILGADAQTLSWSQALVDFPQLGPERTAVSQALRAAKGTTPLRADVFKVPHHGSKHGVNLELVEAIAPKLSLISSVAGGGEYNFPHDVAQEMVREGLEARAGKSSGVRSPDHELGIHYTCERSSAGDSLGTIGLIVTPGGRRKVWRFMDRVSDRINLAHARELA